VTGRLYSPGIPLSSTNKTDRQDIAEILLKVALNTIKQTKTTYIKHTTHCFNSNIKNITYVKYAVHHLRS
jgi:hypothetical protein